MSSRRVGLACGVLVFLVLGSTVASAQRYGRRSYPRGYGGYGWGGWGADPASGYMAGLGSYARGQGVYQVENAKAQAINLETMLKWNQALRARQKELQIEKRTDQAREAADRDARVARRDLEDGTTLNSILMKILDFDPAAAKSSRSRATISASAVREIPFEWNTEAITLCLDQMTGRGGLPPALADDRFASERKTLGQAVEAALKEDVKGDVTPEATKRVSAAVDAFHAIFTKQIPDTFNEYSDCDTYFTTLASLTHLLHDPSMIEALAQLETEKETTVGDLIAFMQTYNLRFGTTTTERQVRIYETLAKLLSEALNSVNTDPPPPSYGENDRNALPSAARDAFKGMGHSQTRAPSGAKP